MSAPQPSHAAQPQYAPQPRNGFGITALVLAIIGLVFGLIPLTGFIALILGALAVLFGLLGVARVRKNVATNKVMSWIGTGLGGLSLVLGIVGIVIVFQATNQFVNDMEQIEAELNQGMPSAPTVDPVSPQATGEPLAGSEYAAAPVTIVLETWGQGTGQLHYTVGSSYNTAEVELPWTKEVEVNAGSMTMTSLSVTRSPSFEAYSAGTAPTGEIGCRITMNGTVVEEHTASGKFASAMCDTLP